MPSEKPVGIPARFPQVSSESLAMVAGIWVSAAESVSSVKLVVLTWWAEAFASWAAISPGMAAPTCAAAVAYTHLTLPTKRIV